MRRRRAAGNPVPKIATETGATAVPSSYEPRRVEVIAGADETIANIDQILNELAEEMSE